MKDKKEKMPKEHHKSGGKMALKAKMGHIEKKDDMKKRSK
jgi:hypothetical protein